MKTYELIPKKLYIGGEPANAERSLEQLRALNIGAVVCLVRRENALLRQAYGARYLRVPMSDGQHVDERQLQSIVHQVLVWISERLPVFVHCHAGRNRAALVGGYAVWRLKGLTGREAVQHVQRCRPRAFENGAFATYLENLPRSSPSYADMNRLALGVEMGIQRRQGRAL